MAKLTRLKTERSGFIKKRAAIVFTFQSRKDDACDRLFSAGQSGQLGFDGRINLSASSRRISRSESLLDQPAAIVTTNSRMGNNFLHIVQTIDLLRENCNRARGELWKYEPIEAFVLMAPRWAHRNSTMPSRFASLFRKTAECPASQSLLAYRRSIMSSNELVYIRSHLASCDFCSAELQLLTRYRSEAEEYSFAEMPAQLRRLAEDLLTRSTAPFKGLRELAENGQASH